MKFNNFINQFFYKFNQMLSKDIIFDVVYIDTPDGVQIKPHRLYIERRGEKDRWLYLRCPCGCEDLISVNLMKSVQPFWTLQKHINRTISLWPSVNKTTGCRSHFFIRHSLIEWAKSNNLP